MAQLWIIIAYFLQKPYIAWEVLSSYWAFGFTIVTNKSSEMGLSWITFPKFEHPDFQFHSNSDILGLLPIRWQYIFGICLRKWQKHLRFIINSETVQRTPLEKSSLRSAYWIFVLTETETMGTVVPTNIEQISLHFNRSKQRGQQINREIRRDN